MVSLDNNMWSDSNVENTLNVLDKSNLMSEPRKVKARVKTLQKASKAKVSKLRNYITNEINNNVKKREKSPMSPYKSMKKFQFDLEALEQHALNKTS